MPFPFLKLARAGFQSSFRFPARSQPSWSTYGWRTGSNRDWSTEVGDLWLQGIVALTIFRIVLACADARQIVYRDADGDGKPEPITNHPLLAILAEPEEDFDDTILRGAVETSIQTSGNAYAYKDMTAGGKLGRLIYLPHFQVEPQPDPKGLTRIGGYKWTNADGEEKSYERNQIAHIRHPMTDPRNPRKGLAPLQTLMCDVALHAQIGVHLATLVRNDAMPGAVVSPRRPEDAMDPEAVDAFDAMWANRFGADGKGRPLVSGIALSVEAISHSPADLQLAQLRRDVQHGVCAAMGADPLMIGLATESQTYDNKQAALRGFVETVLKPWNRVMCSQWTRQLRDTTPGLAPGEHLGYDYSEVAALADDRNAQIRAFSIAVGGPFLTPDEVRGELGYDDVEGGDVLYAPRSAGGSSVPGTIDADRDGMTLDAQQPISQNPSQADQQRKTFAAVGSRWRAAKALAGASNGHGRH